MALGAGPGLVARLDRFFGRFSRPWLAALAAAGMTWALAGFPVAYFGTPVHPAFNLLGAFLHFLGVGTVFASGVIFSILWWREYIDDRFLSE